MRLQGTIQRQLGLGSAIAVVVASMIGIGVFTTSGFLLGDLHSPWLVLLAWAVGGLFAAMGALCYGALGRHIPESGGEYVFLSRTLHPSAGYLAGWVSLFAGFSAPLAAAAWGFGAYTAVFTGWQAQQAGTAAIVLFGALHAWHVGRGARVQDVVVVVKLAFIVVFVGYALPRVGWEPLAMPTPMTPAFAVSLVWISFSYAGWNAAVYVGGEIKNPERNLPRALLLGTGIVTILYLGLNAAFVFSAPVAELRGQMKVAQIAAESIGGAGVARAVSGVIALALLTSISALIMTGPRVYAKMAADGFLPRLFAAGEGMPPRASIVLQCGLALLLLWTSRFEWLLTYIGFTLGISTAATVLGLMFLRIRRKVELEVPGWPWLPALFIAAVTAITVFTIQERPGPSAIGLGTLAAGWIAWWIHSSRSAA